MLMTFVDQIQLCHKSQKRLHAVLIRDRMMRHICLQQGNLSKAGLESVKRGLLKLVCAYVVHECVHIRESKALSHTGCRKKP